MVGIFLQPELAADLMQHSPSPSVNSTVADVQPSIQCESQYDHLLQTLAALSMDMSEIEQNISFIYSPKSRNCFMDSGDGENLEK